MKIKIYSIAKKQNKCDEFIKQIKQFGVTVEDISIFNANIQKAQKDSAISAKESYGIEFSKYLKHNVPNIALHPNGKEVSTLEFSNLLRDKNEINFFIGGSYGFDDTFLSKTTNISLSKLTFSYKITKIIIFEQIFRALCIINNHPYHKE